METTPENVIERLMWFEAYNEEDYCGGDRIQDEHGDWYYKVTEEDFEAFRQAADIIRKYQEMKDKTLPESTTKNNSETDCISKKAALNKIFTFGIKEKSVSVTDLWKEVNELPPVAPESRLVPVSERLPDTDEEVLCWYEYYHWSQGKVLPEYGLGRYLKETSSWSGEVASGRDVRVIAWMPLPKEYNEIKEFNNSMNDLESEEELEQE